MSDREIIEIPYKYKPYPHQIDLFAARDKGIRHLLTRWHRRCFVGDTPIAMGDGTWKDIKDIIPGDIVLSFRNNKLEPKKVIEVFNNGEQKVFKYNDITCTPNHKVLTVYNTYKEIDKTDHLINAGTLRFGNTYDPDLAEVLGLLLTDGYVTKNQSPKFTNVNKDLLDRFDFLVQKVFPQVKTTWYEKDSGFDIVCTTKIKTNYHPIRYYFKTSNTLPDIVWQMDYESTLAFLSGVISGNGSIYYRNTTTPRGFSSLTGQLIIEAGVSPELAEDYKKLLLKFGIRSKIKKDPRSNNYRVYIYSLKSLHNLKGLEIQHKEKMEKFLYVLRNTKPYKTFKQEKIKRGNSFIANTYDISVEDNHNYIANGYIVHNCGKDLSFWNLMIREAVKRKGVYYYVFPYLNQGKKALFEGITNDGDDFMGFIPPTLKESVNIQDQKVKLSNGSIIQIIGTDNYDKVRGTNPVGVVFSEYAYQNPGARSVVKPILVANNGWEAINSTPNGKNHMYHLEMKINKRTGDDIEIDDRWFVSIKNIEETIKHDGSPIITPERVWREAEDEGWSDEFVEQEYWVSYNANAQGYYFLSYLNEAREQGRVGSFPWNPDKPVFTYWDIGVGDSTAIWFMQWIDGKPYVIDFYTAFSAGIEHYASELSLNHRRKYVYAKHIFPHDMINTEFGTGRSRLEIAEDLFGRDKVDMGPKLGFDDGIQAARMFLAKCYFDENEFTEKGLMALENYQREWNDERKEFAQKPVHNWASHPADAFRYMAVASEKPKEKVYLKDRLAKYRRSLNKKSWLAA